MPLASALPRGRYQVPSGQMLATSAVTAAPVAALVLLFQRRIVSSLTGRALKDQGWAWHLANLGPREAPKV